MKSTFTHSSVYVFEMAMEEVLILLCNYKTIPLIGWFSNITRFLLLLRSERAALPKDRAQMRIYSVFFPSPTHTGVHC